ncbi:hypothetical protein EON62_00955 [archaeon]|nr:MAG: hypothetical protein EON62_00955 [archaeon]
MGKPMCANLIKAGHSVTIFDGTHAHCRPAAPLRHRTPRV